MEPTSAAAPRTPSPGEIGALVALVERERLSEAESKARMLLSANPNAGMLWKILGVALMRQGKDAVPALRRTAELMPRDAEAHGNLGLALHDQGQWTEALASLRRALAIAPRDVQALVAAANAIRALGRAREAIPLYRQALALEPRRVEARNNLGNALLELGECGEAVDCYRRALEIEPEDAQLHCNLGNALRQLGFLEEAIASSRRAVALDPALSVAHNNLGLSLAALGDRSAAVTHYVRAIELDPGRPEIHCNLGSALFELRRVDEAAESFRRALALEPDDVLAHWSLGAALRQQGRAAEAEAICQAALNIDPGSVEALTLLGELRADRGRFSEAEELFRRAIAMDPGCPNAWFGIASHRRMTAGDTDWLEGAEALLAKRLSRRDEVNLQYALGKYFDDVGRYDRAFGHYRQANELAKLHGASYDNTKLARRVDEMIGSFDAASVRNWRRGGSGSQLPILVVGMPRSGTSLAEQILASHPQVFGAGELSFWDTAFLAWKKARLESADAADLLAGMAADYLVRLTASSGNALRVVDKMPANFLYAGLIHAALPAARIIHMRRHPIDTCLSIYFQNFFNVTAYANDLDHLADYYAQYVRITDHWRNVLPAASLLEVPYEGLVEDQEGWTRRMLDFVGLPWDPKCLAFHETDRVVITASRWQVRQKLHAQSAGRWRRYEKHVGPLRRLLEPTRTPLSP
ncbi:MAG: tetratricopeptide repeat protein [Steroidobacteraceae bacterium]